MPAGPNAWWERARDEIVSARVLKQSGQATQAYHHAGQAVEFALKAIYMRRRSLVEWPPRYRGAEWHHLARIAEEAGLGPDLNRLQRESHARYANWLTAADWDSNVRFPGNAVSSRELNDLFLAICHERDGIMVWLETIFQNA